MADVKARKGKWWGARLRLSLVSYKAHLNALHKSVQSFLLIFGYFVYVWMKLLLICVDNAPIFLLFSGEKW